jgi:hypothetical protein
MTAAPESIPSLPAPAGAQRTVRHRVRTSMTRQEWTRVGGMAAVIVALHVIGWFTLVAIVAPEHHAIGTQTFGVGIGVTAYTLGMRHAFDADHIAAIDNTTRKLMGANVVDGRGDGIVTYHGFRRTTHRGAPSERLWVYGRVGRPCRRCGAAIELRRQGPHARSTYYCPRCQNGSRS